LTKAADSTVLPLLLEVHLMTGAWKVAVVNYSAAK